MLQLPLKRAQIPSDGDRRAILAVPLGGAVHTSPPDTIRPDGAPPSDVPLAQVPVTAQTLWPPEGAAGSGFGRDAV